MLLSGSFNMDLSVELKKSKNGLLKIKNKDQKKILWRHVRHINPSKEHPERIKKKLTKKKKKKKKKMLKNLIMIL